MWTRRDVWFRVSATSPVRRDLRPRGRELSEEVDGEENREEDRSVGHRVRRAHTRVAIGCASDEGPDEFGPSRWSAIGHDLDDVVGAADVERTDGHRDIGEGHDEGPRDIPKTLPRRTAVDLGRFNRLPRHGEKAGEDQDGEDRRRGPDLGDNDGEE